MPLSERLPRRYTSGPNDIFAIVKHHMSDSEPCQPALLVLPGDESMRIKQFWSASVADMGVDPTLEPDRQSDLLELASTFETYPNYGRAVAYLKSLAGHGPRTRHAAHDLPFLRAGGLHAPGLVCANVPPRERQQPHHLQVRFHRP